MVEFSVAVVFEEGQGSKISKSGFGTSQKGIDIACCSPAYILKAEKFAESAF